MAETLVLAVKMQEIKMKILIADDHALFRDGLSMHLEQIAPDAVISQAGNFSQALKILDAEPKIDLIIIDLDMPDMKWEEGLSQLKSKAPDVLSLSLLLKIPGISKKLSSSASAAICPNVRKPKC